MTTSWRSREELVHQIVTLARDGLSRRAITRAVGVSRNTVKAVLAAHQSRAHGGARRAQPAPRARTARLEARSVQAANRRAHDPVLGHHRPARVREPARRRLRAAATTRSRSTCARPVPSRSPSRAWTTPEYGPGEMGESDWSPYAITFTDGQRMIVQALSYVLVHSTRKFFALFTSNDLHALMDGHAQAFDALQGMCTPMQVRQPEARRPAVGGQPAHLQSSLPRVLEPLRVQPPRRPPRPPKRQAPHREILLGSRAFVPQRALVPRPQRHARAARRLDRRDRRSPPSPQTLRPRALRRRA